MTGETRDADRFWSLLDAACAGTLVESQAQELALLLDSDSAVRSLFIDHVQLRRDIQSVCRAEGVCDRALSRIGATVPQMPLLGEQSDISLSPAFLSPSLRSATGYFSSGWPAAYLIATVIFGVGLAIGAYVRVSDRSQIVEQSPSASKPQSASEPKSQFVGRITGLVDCQWADPDTEAIQGAHVPLGRKYALRSGLLEITYDNGAKVILQGPVTYEVESARGGYLSIGKLTARLEKGTGLSNQKSTIRNQELFAVRTPTATVTDLGTEFGVEVTKEGQTTSHVFRGSVKVRLLGAGADRQGGTVILHENESVETRKDPDAKDANIVLRPVKVDPQMFMRRVTQPIDVLYLSDIAAGGDGRSQFHEHGANDDVVLAPKAYFGRRFSVYPTRMIDRVFAPCPGKTAVELDSAGHGFSDFPKIDGASRGSIWATVADASADAKPTSARCGLLGIRPNAGITFDLKAMRERYCGYRPKHFRSVAFCGSPAKTSTVLFQDDFNGSEVNSHWTTDADATSSVAVGGGLATLHSGAAQYNYVSLWGDSAMLAGLGSATDWYAEARFRVTGNMRTTPDRDVILLSGRSAPTADGVNRGVDFRLMQDATGPDGATFNLGWHGYGDARRVAKVIASGLNKGQFYTVSAHRKSNDNVDVYLNGKRIATETVLGLPDNPLLFGIGEVAGNSSVEALSMDYVKASVPPGLRASQRLGLGNDGQGDLWVFVDGQPKLTRTKLRPADGAVSIDVELGPDDRFLTLVSTNVENTDVLTWIVFGNPVLEMGLEEGN